MGNAGAGKLISAYAQALDALRIMNIFHLPMYFLLFFSLKQPGGRFRNRSHGANDAFTIPQV